MVLPLLIAVCLVGDLVARSLPIDPLCFQAWECVTRYQEPGSIFEANRQFRSDRTHGNMSNMGNLTSDRVYRPQVFSTDRFGFRNASHLASSSVRTVMVGDSFVAGYGISDDETLPVQLSALAHVPVYNAGGPYAYADTVRRLKTTLGIQGGSAIIVWSESEPIALLQAAEAQAGQPNWQARVLTSVLGDKGREVRTWLRGWWFTSPVKVVAQKAFLAVSNDHVLPNVYAQLVVERRLTNGAPILFLPTDVDAFHQHRDVTPAAEYLRWLSAAMLAEGVRPLVVLVPHKYSVYYAMLNAAQPPPGDAVHPLATLESALREQGLDALDLTPLLQDRARAAIARGEYLYWRDDTHWNGLGVRVAAEAIQQRWFADRGTER